MLGLEDSAQVQRPSSWGMWETWGILSLTLHSVRILAQVRNVL